MGYHSRATVHGMRSLFSTWANEHGWRPDVIEKVLAHEQQNEVRRAYNRALLIPERRKLLQAWSDFIDTQRGQHNVVDFKSRAG